MVERICSFPDCGRPHKARGYCMSHYQMQRAGKPLLPIWKKPRGETCAFPECGKPVHARDLCAGHLAQLQRGRELRPLSIKKSCAVEGCDGITQWVDYCKIHRGRLYYKGSLDLDPKPDIEDRFWTRVDKTPYCWLWTGAKNHLGYGSFYVAGSSIGAHRASLLLEGVEIPDDWDVDHLCRKPSCVNPAHLEPVPHKVNMERAPWSAPEAARAQTSCRNGHQYTPENTEWRPDNKRGTLVRRCLICHRANRAKRNALLRARRAASKSD